MPGRHDVVAVVDADADEVSVWWVDVGHREIGPRAKRISRLCGAWSFRPATSEVIETLTFQRMIWATEIGLKALGGLRVPVRRHFDVVATLDLMNADRDRHKEAFEIEQASRTPSKRLQAPDWPLYPEPIDLDQLSRAQPGEPPTIARALAAARWLDQLCAQWDSFEETRLSSSWLATIQGAGTRELPIAVKESEP
jgi:hypothetical protein